MSGNLVFLGNQSVGNCVPAVGLLIGAQLPALAGQLAGATAVSTALSIGPPTVSLGAQAATQLAASAGFTGPTIGLQAAGMLTLITTLKAQIAALNVQLGLLGSAGISLYAYSGDVGSMGATIAASTGGGLPGGNGPTDFCNALLLATTLPGAWSALGTFLKTV